MIMFVHSSVAKIERFVKRGVAKMAIFGYFKRLEQYNCNDLVNFTT